MDSPTGLLNIVWLLVFVIVLLVTVLGIVFYILMRTVGQSAGQVIQRRDGGDDPGGAGGPGGPDLPGRVDQASANLTALVNLLEKKQYCTRAELEEEKKKLSLL